MVKRSKSGRGDEAKLITRAPCFLAYYPGEQYFYCDRSEPPPAIPDVSEQRGAVFGHFMLSTHVAPMDCCTTFVLNADILSIRCGNVSLTIKQLSKTLKK